MNIRQSGRRRGRNNGGNNRPQGGGNRGGHDSGNRIDSRTRGNAAQMIEKYKNLARDAQLSGDRVQTEYYLQFADHYFRVLMDFRARQEESRPQGQGQDRWQNRIEGVENFDGRDDIDPMDLDGGPADDDGGDEDGDDRAPRRDDRSERSDRGDRQDRGPRQDRGNRDGNRAPRDDRSPREDRGGRDDRGNRDDRGGRDVRRDRGDRPQRVPEAGDGAADRDERPAAEPRGEVRARLRRPRAVQEDAGDAVIDTAVLPPAIARPASKDVADDGANADAPAPKVRRPRRTLAARDTGAEAAE